MQTVNANLTIFDVKTDSRFKNEKAIKPAHEFKETADSHFIGINDWIREDFGELVTIPISRVSENKITDNKFIGIDDWIREDFGV